MTDTAAIPRMIGVDLARSVAIFLAMLSHVWVATEMGQFCVGPLADLLGILMALATPTFILLFGTMLEIVYYPRFNKSGSMPIAIRLLSRALQCWLLYCLSVLVLYIVSPGYSLKFSIATMLMLGVTPFTDILKFYTLVLLMAPFLLWLRRRVGLLPLVIAAVTIHIAHPLVRGLPSPLDFNLGMNAERVVTFLFGVGDAKLGGPSILHGTSLIIGGMVFGRLIAGDRSVSSPNLAESIFRRSTLILMISVLAFAVGFISYGSEPLERLGDISSRMDSDPLYFVAGFCGAITMTSLVILTTQLLSTKTKQTLETLVFFGRTSLFTFAFGNMLLYGWLATPDTIKLAMQQSIALIVIITALSYWFDREVRRGGMLAQIVSQIQSSISSFVKAVLRRTSKVKES